MYKAAHSLKNLANELNYDPISLAVAWVLNNDAVTPNNKC